MDHCFPDFDIWTQFASYDFTRALELDALKNSHPIEVGSLILLVFAACELYFFVRSIVF